MAHRAMATPLGILLPELGFFGAQVVDAGRANCNHLVGETESQLQICTIVSDAVSSNGRFSGQNPLPMFLNY